jgi:serine/threonine protein kinase
VFDIITFSISWLEAHQIIDIRTWLELKYSLHNKTPILNRTDKCFEHPHPLLPIMAEQLAWYQYPDKKQHDLWYEHHKRNCTIYFHFPDDWEDEDEIRLGLKEAIRLDTCALRITRKCHLSALADNPQYRRLRDRLIFEACEYKPYIPHFNTDFVSVDHNELVDIKELTHNIKIVSFRGQQFVHKFITPGRHQNSFETEVENYKKLADAPGVPRLTAVVRKDGLIQGLLMSYIDGTDLWSTVYNTATPEKHLDEPFLLDITFKLIRLAADLERCNFYHEDLKCTNIVRRHTDGQLFFIDLGGGLTDGMYRPERESVIYSQGPDATDALFTLGRTIWELWVADSPRKGAPLDRVHNGIVRDIIRDCEEGRLESIMHLSDKYSSLDICSRYPSWMDM